MFIAQDRFLSDVRALTIVSGLAWFSGALLRTVCLAMQWGVRNHYQASE